MRSSLFPSGSVNELLILLAHCSSSKYKYKTCSLVQAHSRAAEKCKQFCAALKYGLYVHRIYCSLDVIGKQYWIVLESDFDKVSNSYCIISPIYFHLNRYRRMAKEHLRNYFCQKIWFLSRDLVPSNGNLHKDRASSLKCINKCAKMRLHARFRLNFQKCFPVCTSAADKYANIEDCICKARKYKVDFTEASCQ